ncbi:MAG TPA: hypothetical protein VNO79_10175 [Actinomycetota bacterium]|nr:hypothetical protein [Actinomycetota bacterium]
MPSDPAAIVVHDPGLGARRRGPDSCDSDFEAIARHTSLRTYRLP